MNTHHLETPESLMRQQKLKTGHDKRRMTTKTKNRGTKTWQKKDDKDFTWRKKTSPWFLPIPAPPRLFSSPSSHTNRPRQYLPFGFHEFCPVKNHMPYAIPSFFGFHEFCPGKNRMPYAIQFEVPWIVPRYQNVKTLCYCYPGLTVKPTAPKHGIKAAAATVGDDVSSQAAWHVTHHPEEVQLLFSYFPE